MLEQNVFINLQLPVSRQNCEQITNIIAQLYKNKLQLAKTRNIYEKINSRILWFLNTSQYKQRLILAYFIYKEAIKLFPDLANCYDKFMYNHINVG